MVEFRVLGSVEARVDGQLVEVGPPQARCVLVALLADANRVVSADQLVDRVWADRVPRSARSTLRSYLSRLRQALAAGEVEIVRRSGGYVLAVDPETVDLHHFRTLVAQARTADDDKVALALFDRALGLWRGEVFAGLDTPWINTLRDALDAERVAAEADHTDLRLRQGAHGALVAELAGKVANRPLDERLAGQFMLALYRNGRQADALAHFDQVRSQLAEELGADPGPALREMHQQILTTDPALVAPGAPGAGRTRSPMPRQLPPAPGMFAGRVTELARLTTALDADTGAGRTVVISSITGTGGIGKTWLALHWAYQHLHQFPDGQLFVDLRGFTPAGQPTPPGVAVRAFLDAFGVEPDRIPVELDAQVGLYRSLVAGKQLLIVLDNARDTSQVSTLLPGSPSSMVLVTSRDRLAGLVTSHAAHRLGLDVLDEDDALDLLTRRLGRERINAEPAAVRELLTYCAGLPLALGIVAGRATGHPDFPLAALAGELRDTPTRLDVLDQGDHPASLTAVLSWSYHALTPEQAAVFGLLGLAPGPDISLPAAASLTGLSITRTGAVLRALERVSLVDEHAPGRWQMHDLIRVYAANTAHHDQPQNHREAALRRLVDHYIHTAYAGDRLLHPHSRSITLDPAGPACHPEPLRDDVAALEWFDTEHPCLLATHQLTVDRGWHRAVWHMAWSLNTFHTRRGHLHHWLAVWRAGLAAANHLDDPVVQALAHRQLGNACARLGRYDEALDHLTNALTLTQDISDLYGQAHTHKALAGVWERRGDDRRALDHTTHALHLFRALGNPVWEAGALNNVGWYEARLGHYTEARVHCGAALALFRRHHNRAGQASTLDSLGYLSHHTGQHPQARDYYQQALTLYHDLGNTYNEANTLNRLGETHLAISQHDQARDTWQQALRLYQAQHRTTDAEHVQRQLDNLTQPDHERHAIDRLHK